MTWKARPRSEFGGLSAIISGTGPLIVLIHGVGLRAEAWNKQIDALSPHFRIVAVDMPGHGESPMLESSSALADYTDVVAATIEEPALLIGHSMGAMIALDLACRFPDRVGGVATRRTPHARSGVGGVRRPGDGRRGAVGGPGQPGPDKPSAGRRRNRHRQ